MKAFSHTESTLNDTLHPETGQKYPAIPPAAVIFCFAARILSLCLRAVPIIVMIFQFGVNGGVGMLALQKALSSLAPGLIPVICGIVLLKTGGKEKVFPAAALPWFAVPFTSVITLFYVFVSSGFTLSGEMMRPEYWFLMIASYVVYVFCGVLLLLRKRNVTVAIPAFAFVVLRTVTLIGGFTSRTAAAVITAYVCTGAAFLAVGLAALGTVGAVPPLCGFAKKLCKLWFLPAIVYTAGQIIAGTIDKGLPGLKSATEAISLTSVLLVLYVVYLRQLQKTEPEKNGETCAES